MQCAGGARRGHDVYAAQEAHGRESRRSNQQDDDLTPRSHDDDDLMVLERATNTDAAADVNTHPRPITRWQHTDTPHQKRAVRRRQARVGRDRQGAQRAYPLYSGGEWSAGPHTGPRTTETPYIRSS